MRQCQEVRYRKKSILQRGASGVFHGKCVLEAAVESAQW